MVPAPEPEVELEDIEEHSEDNHGEKEALTEQEEEGEEQKGEGSAVIIIVAVCIIIVCLSAVFVLNYKRKLHPFFYQLPWWKPVQGDMDAEKEKHCSIIKDGGGLDVSELGLLDDGGNMMADITTVTYMGEKEGEEKEEEQKEEEKEAESEEKSL